MGQRHGTRAKFRSGCQCESCTIAAAEYERRNGRRRDPYYLPNFGSDAEWMKDGACKTADLPTKAYFPDQHHPQALAVALKVCETCPATVKDECLQFALRHRLSGVWGGTSERQRRKMKARAA